MSAARCCCVPDVLGCDSPSVCVRVTLAGVEMVLEPHLFAETGGGGFIQGTLQNLAGINRTHVAASTYDTRDGINPAFVQMRCGHEDYPSTVSACVSPPTPSPKTSRLLQVTVTMSCVDDVFEILEVRASFDVGLGPDEEVAGDVFRWFPDHGDPGVAPGSTVPNLLTATVGGLAGVTTDIGINGTATVEVVASSACSPTTEYAIGAKCDDPTTTVAVDLATNVDDRPGFLYEGELYELTPNTTPDAPASVTWTAERCPTIVSGDWFEAIRCPPPGRLNGGYPEKVRYYRPAGGTTDGAVYLVFLDTPRPGCFVSIRYYPTETPTTDDTLQIGIFSFGAEPCNALDVRVCEDDIEPPQNLCEICINVGPDDPVWLQEYCAEFCSPAIIAPPSAPMGAQRSGIARAASKLWTAAQMAASYAEAKASGRTADERTIALRQLSCFGDPAAGVPACPQLRETAAGRFCGACGCGQRRDARLDPDPTTGLSKLQFGVLRCPLGRPGFTNHDPPPAAQKGR